MGHEDDPGDVKMDESKKTNGIKLLNGDLRESMCSEDAPTKLLELTKLNDDSDSVDLRTNGSSRNLPLKRQTLMTLGTFMLTLGAGATAGFSAVLIPQLKHANGNNNFSTEMESWVAAISSLALVFGNITSGYLMERFGRRTSLLLLSVPFICGWVIIALSGNVYWILLGRFITGFCQGWLGPLGPVFVGEISAPVYRGFFLAALSLAIATGVFFSHLFGTFLQWSTASLLCGLFPFAGGVILYYAPESPGWLASKDKIEECIASFKWYRGDSLQMKQELENIIAEQSKKDNTQNKLITLKKNIKKPEFWKPLGIMTTFFVITQLSGVNVICAYTPDIMKKLIGKKLHKYADNTMLIIDVLRCISLGFACYLLRRLGRRPMALFSGSLTSLSLIVLAIYLYLVDGDIIKNLSPIISLGLMVIYMIVSNLGIVPLPWNMVGELFATDTKGVGSGISVMMTSLAFFGTVKTAPGMFRSIGYQGAYLFYGVSTLLGTMFLFFCLPETKDRTLLQIEEHFRHGRNSKVVKSSINNIQAESV